MPTTALNITLPTVGGSRNSWGGLNNQALQVLDDFVADVSPIGTIHMWSGSTAPTTAHSGVWLVCDGSAVSQTTYSDLYTILSPLQAVLDPSSNAGSGNFRLPDLRGRAPLGYVNNTTVNGRSSFDNTSRSIGANGGNENSTLTLSQTPTHTHTGSATAETNDVDPRTPGDNVNDDASTSVVSGDADLTDAGHSHTGEITNRVMDAWSTSQTGLGFGVSSADGTSYAIAIGRDGSTWYSGYNKSDTDYSDLSPSGTGYRGGTINTVSIADGTASITDSGHVHTIPDLTHNHSVSLTVTNQTTGGTGTLGQASPHSIVNPFFVVSFIILAKVPRVS